MRFKPGDLIMYGDTGVCRVEEISLRALPSGDELCYKLQPLYQSCTIYTPAESESVFMRAVITREEAERMIDAIPDCEHDICELTSPRELSNRYDEIIACHDCGKLISLTMSIYDKKQLLITRKKKLSAVDEKYMKKAEELLFGELAAALGIKKESVRSYIDSRTA